MNKWKLLLIIIFMGAGVGYAQQKLEIQGSGSSLYLNHQVLPQETFYSVGRLYNVSPRNLASFNQLQMDNGLNVGQNIKIPLDRNNFAQEEVKSVLDFYVPLYHTVKPGETLYRLSTNYSKAPVESIKKWNSLTSETVSEGVPLIVGFLKVDKNQSAFAKDNPADLDMDTEQSTPAVANAKAETSTSAQIEHNETSSSAMPANNATAGGDGFFKQVFDISAATHANVQGLAGVFKSTSGWQDEKYYCLNNEAAPGSIVKVTDQASGKSVYAKVLDAIPDIKQNSGLVVIISNSAADRLGKGEEHFNCTVTYEK